MSKYTVFSHKGGVRILADKSTKIKRLRLSRETIIQLDALIAARRIKIHAHLRARVFIYVWCVWNPFSGFDDIILHCLREISWAAYALGEKFLSPLVPRAFFIRSPLSRVLATFDYQNNLCLSAQHLLSQMRFFVYCSRISCGAFP